MTNDEHIFTRPPHAAAHDEQDWENGDLARFLVEPGEDQGRTNKRRAYVPSWKTRKSPSAAHCRSACTRAVLAIKRAQNGQRTAFGAPPSFGSSCIDVILAPVSVPVDMSIHTLLQRSSSALTCDGMTVEGSSAMVS